MLLTHNSKQFIWGFNMSLFDKVIALYPELSDDYDFRAKGIVLVSENDKESIDSWTYSKPLDKSLESYKR